MKLSNPEILRILGVTFTLLLGLTGCFIYPPSGMETSPDVARSSEVAPQNPTQECKKVPNELPPEISFDPVEGVGTIAISNDGLTLYRTESKSSLIIYPIVGETSKVTINSILWSPDGKKLGFVYQTGVNPLCKFSYLMIANLTKGSVKRIISISDQDGPLSWSPNGKKAAFVNRAGELLTIDTETGSFALIKKDGVPGSSTDWMDDNVVAYVRAPSPNANSENLLIGLNLQESTEEMLINEVLSAALANPGIFDITSNGDYLAYIYGGNVYIQNLRDGSSSNVYVDQSPERLNWSLDSRVLAISVGMAGVGYINDLSSPTFIPTNILGLLGSQPWVPNGHELIVSEGTDRIHSLKKCDFSTSHCAVLDIVYQPPYVWAVNPIQD